MAGTSFLTPPAVADIHQALADLFATRKALANPPVFLVLQRPDGAGGYTDIPAQEVVVRFHKRVIQENASASEQNPLVVGELQKEPPFDVAQDDVFVLPSGQVGTVTHVFFQQKAYLRALFTLEERAT